MAPARVLIANRGEIAVRIVETLRSEGVESVALYAEDDATGPWVHLSLITPRPYLAPARRLTSIRRPSSPRLASGATAVHPGYGFLSENAAFAERCEDAGLTFLGPTPAQLRALGSKTEARSLARSLGVPLLPGTEGATSLEDALAFQKAHPRAPHAQGRQRRRRSWHSARWLKARTSRRLSPAVPRKRKRPLEMGLST